MQIREAIENSLFDIDKVSERNKSEPKEEGYMIHATQAVLSQFLDKNTTIEYKEMEHLYVALSKLMEIVFSQNLENNYFIRCQRNKIAIVFCYMAQKLSIEAVNSLNPTSSSLPLTDTSLKYANFALSIVSDLNLKKQTQQIINSQIIHNHNVCEMAENTKEEIETQWAGSTQRLIKNLNNPSSKEIKPTENSARILVWILILAGALILTFF